MYRTCLFGGKCDTNKGDKFCYWQLSEQVAKEQKWHIVIGSVFPSFLHVFTPNSIPVNPLRDFLVRGHVYSKSENIMLFDADAQVASVE